MGMSIFRLKPYAHPGDENVPLNFELIDDSEELGNKQRNTLTDILLL